MPPFRFKQFSVGHDRCGHKVGTDAVVLGAWTSVTGAKTILDIGTASGILALMLAQRTEHDVFVDAVDPGQDDCLQATQNVKNSPWSNRIKVYTATIQDFNVDKKYDLIISNPPFFTNSLVPPSGGRQLARHTTSLSHHDLLSAVRLFLSDSGKFSVVLPTVEGQQFQSLAAEFGLFCSRELALFSRKEKPQERWLMEFSKRPTSKISETLVLLSRENEWSAEYKKLTVDFYLGI